MKMICEMKKNDDSETLKCTMYEYPCAIGINGWASQYIYAYIDRCIFT